MSTAYLHQQTGLLPQQLHLMLAELFEYEGFTNSLEPLTLEEVRHMPFHFVFSRSVYSCLVAEVLLGRVLQSRVRRSSSLPAAASLANLATCSLPFTSLWLEIHRIVTLALELFSMSAKAHTGCWPILTAALSSGCLSM